MPILTLARYILEYSLMDYNTVTLSDSKLASAALYLALQMKNVSGWTKTLEFYTGIIMEEQNCCFCFLLEYIVLFIQTVPLF